MSPSPTIRDLSLQMRVEEVGTLQDALQKLGYGDTISKEEKEEKYIGPGTREAIIAFQTTNNLEKTGIIDNATLVKLYEVTEKEGPHEVSGAVVSGAGVPLTGFKAVAIDRGLTTPTFRYQLGTFVRAAVRGNPTTSHAYPDKNMMTKTRAMSGFFFLYHS